MDVLTLLLKVTKLPLDLVWVKVFDVEVEFLVACFLCELKIAEFEFLYLPTLCSVILSST